MKKYESENEKTKKKQKRNYLFLLLIIFAGGALFFMMLFPSPKSHTFEEGEAVFDLPGAGVDTREMRLVGLENDLIKQEKMSEALLDQQMEIKEILFDLKSSPH